MLGNPNYVDVCLSIESPQSGQKSCSMVGERLWIFLVIGRELLTHFASEHDRYGALHYWHLFPFAPFASSVAGTDGKQIGLGISPFFRCIVNMALREIFVGEWEGKRVWWRYLFFLTGTRREDLTVKWREGRGKGGFCGKRGV